MTDSFEVEKLAFEQLKHARERWWYEEKLVHQRLTWFFSAQGLLGLGYAWLRYRVTDVLALPGAIKQVDLYVGQLERLAYFLLGLGLAVCVFTLIGVHAAFSAQSQLKREGSNKYFRLDVSERTTLLGKAMAYGLPMTALFAWVAALRIL